jgi:hypothetical protein
LRKYYNRPKKENKDLLIRISAPSMMCAMVNIEILHICNNILNYINIYISNFGA